MLATVAGSTKGYKDGPALQAQLNLPMAIAAGPGGAIYICDSYRVRMLKQGELSTVAGTGTSGFRDGPAAQAQFSTLQGIAVTFDGTIFVSDYENLRIRMIKDGGVTTVAGNGSEGHVDGPTLGASLYGPRGIALGNNGALYIADHGYYCIRQLKDGKLTTIAGRGPEGLKDGPALKAEFECPNSIVVGPDGCVHICETWEGRLRALKDGKVSTIAALEGQLNTPEGITVDIDGNIYICDHHNNRIAMLAAKDGTLSTVASPISKPMAVCIGSDGLLYMSDSENGLIKTLALPDGRSFLPVPRGSSDWWNMIHRPVDLSKSIDFATDVEIAFSDSTMKLHRSLAELRCPGLLGNTNLKSQQVGKSAVAAFQKWLYSDELPASSDTQLWQDLARLFQQSNSVRLAQDCLKKIEAGEYAEATTASETEGTPVLSLSSALEELLNATKDGGDFEIGLPGMAPVKCHQFVLNARWSYFASIINAEGHDPQQRVLNIPGQGQDGGMHPIILKAILEICYLGRLKAQTSDELSSLGMAQQVLALSNLYLQSDINSFEALTKFAEYNVKFSAAAVQQSPRSQEKGSDGGCSIS